MRRRQAAVALALLAAAAGCGGVAPGPDGGETTGPLSETTAVTVTAVVDGDTVRIEYPDGTRDTVRLVGVDTPEVNTANDPAEFEGVPDTEAGAACLRAAGENATTAATTALLGERVGVATDPNLDRRGYYDRLLAYVVLDGRLFNYRLVTDGHARVYDSDFTRRGNFTAAETSAREERRGLWRCVESDAGSRSVVGDSAVAAE
jgi:micrococcal nuclease